LNSLNKKYQERHKDYPDTGKDKKHCYQNKMFRTDCKKFYSILRQKNTDVKHSTPKEEMEKFWKEIFGRNVQHNEEAY